MAENTPKVEFIMDDPALPPGVIGWNVYEGLDRTRGLSGCRWMKQPDGTLKKEPIPHYVSRSRLIGTYVEGEGYREIGEIQEAGDKDRD